MQELQSFCHRRQHSHVSCGLNHTAFLKEGSLYTFGSNYWGQLGLGGTKYLSIKLPTLVPFNEPIMSVSCGNFHTAFITYSGKLYTFGSSAKGVLGDGTEDEEREEEYDDYDSDGDLIQYESKNIERRVTSPILIPFAERIVFVSCGDDHTAVITAGGKLYSFGLNSRGKLGIGLSGAINIPTPVTLEALVSSVKCGEDNTAIITESGELYTVGYSCIILDNTVGNRCIEQLLPVLMPFEKSVTLASYSRYYMAVVMEDNSVTVVRSTACSETIDSVVALRTIECSTKGITILTTKGDVHSSFEKLARSKLVASLMVEMDYRRSRKAFIGADGVLYTSNDDSKIV